MLARIGHFIGGPAAGGGGRIAHGDVVAWGDSLTAIAFFGDAFANSFSPSRTFTNAGIGSQTSPQIAARQGGSPALLTLQDNIIPPSSEPTAYDFSDGVGAWTTSLFNGGQTGISVVDGKLHVGTITALDGAWVPLGSVTAGETFIVDFGAGITGGSFYIRVYGSGTFISDGLAFVDGHNGPVVLTIASNEADAYVSFTRNDSDGEQTFTLDNVSIRRGNAPIAVTGRSASPITYQGPGPIAGTLRGVHGTLAAAAMTSDADDDTVAYTFTRDDAGADVSCPANSPFLPDQAVNLRGQVTIFWSGRNNFSNPTQVKADIAAMVAYHQGGNYLVGSVLTASGDGAGIATILALNADLAAIYGARYVDILGAMQAANDGSANDLADVAAGLTPRSLRQDTLHPNAAGSAVIQAAWHDAIIGAGY
jgi:hypothetical protein